MILRDVLSGISRSLCILFVHPNPSDLKYHVSHYRLIVTNEEGSIDTTQVFERSLLFIFSTTTSV